MTSGLKRALLILGLILLTALGLRLGYALSPDTYRSADEAAYESLAASMYMVNYGGHKAGASDPFHWSPGAPALFAVSFALKGDAEPDAARLSQALVGTLLVLVVYLLALRLCDRRTPALMAAALTAAYPPLFKHSGDLLSEPLGAFLLTGSVLVLMYAIKEHEGRLPFVAAGALLGATALTRTDYLLLPVILIPAVVLITRRAQPALILAAAFLLTLAPWTVMSSLKEGRLVPVSTGYASPLFLGTYLPGNGQRTKAKWALLPEVTRLHPSLAGQLPRRVQSRYVLDAVAARNPGLPRDRAIALEALRNLRRYALGEPLAFTAMMAGKVPRMWGRPYDGGRYPAGPVLRAVHLAYLGLGLCGLFLLGLSAVRRREALILFGVVGYSAALHLLVVAIPRYNLPLMPLLIALGTASVSFHLAETRPGLTSGSARKASRSPLSRPAATNNRVVA